MIDRQSVDVDIACVGFGPAVAGFLSVLSKGITPELESQAAPGMPLQVMCYERASDVGFGVSGVVTRGRAIRATFPELDPQQIPMAQPVEREKVAYLLDPVGASRRTGALRAADAILRGVLRVRDHALELPYIPPFLQKHDGMILSLGQFTQWVGSQVMGSGAVQLWPGMPVSEPLFEGEKVVGIRLADQGVDRSGAPAEGFMPGMDVRAGLTVVGDGPVGAVGQKLDRRFGLPDGNHKREWAVGMKMVVDLPERCALEPGTVLHTIGYPEPEIFGFLYVHPGKVASLGIFVPSFLRSPIRTSYRYLQHWMQHPYLWKHLQGGTLRSWGAKSLFEGGQQGEPFLAGDGYARIGEGSGSTNVLSGSGVDEAWATGALLAEGVLELAREKKPFTRENLEKAYVERRRRSWLEREARVAKHSRDGFHRGFLAGVIGMGITGMTSGKLTPRLFSNQGEGRVPSLEEHCKGRISALDLAELRRKARAGGIPLHDLVMDRLGWPEIQYDGKLLVSHQDALLMGGKVQAPPGFADHVVFLSPEACKSCDTQLCVEICSAQAISPGEDGVPRFDREKCVHCGACLWNCQAGSEANPLYGNLDFRAGAGGLNSSEN